MRMTDGFYGARIFYACFQLITDLRASTEHARKGPYRFHLWAIMVGDDSNHW
jgi:hypothetical protein